MSPRRRPGFTLFDLLVLIAILAFLLALLLPALAYVRRAAARAQSQNNLKQLGLGCHSYHNEWERFPPGNDKHNFSTTAYLLPYIDQGNIFAHLDFKKDMDAKVNAVVREVRIAILISPLDPLPAEGKFGPTNYLFNAGSKYALKDNNGIFYHDSKVKIAEIADGTSNTLMIGETLRGDGQTKAVDVHRQHVLLGADALAGLDEQSGVQQWQAGKDIAGNRGASWLDGRFLQGTFTGTRTLNDSRPDVSCGGAGGLSGLRSLDGGANIAFCDGSVRFVRANLDLAAWKNLADKADNNAVNID